MCSIEATPARAAVLASTRPRCALTRTLKGRTSSMIGTNRLRSIRVYSLRKSTPSLTRRSTAFRASAGVCTSMASG